MVIIPPRETKKLVQTNRSTIIGNLWSSLGLDLHSNLGVIRLSPRLMVNTAVVTNQGRSVAFNVFDSRVFTVAGTRIFKNTDQTLTSAFVEDASTGAATTYDPLRSDMTLFNGVLAAVTQTEILTKASNGSGTGAWTSRYTLAVTNSIHKMNFFTRHNRLYFIDNFTEIKSMNTSYTTATSGDYFISIPYVNGQPYTLDSDSNDIWIGTIGWVGDNGKASHGSILRWDGVSSQITAEYKIKAQGVLALCKDDRGIMHAIDSNGALLQFTGSGFEEIARLPLNREYLVNAFPTGVGGAAGGYSSFIHPNGFEFTKNGTFIVLINNLVGDNAGSIKENLPSGIWEYHKDTGFVHRQSLTYTPLGTTTVTDYGQNRVSAVGALAELNLYSASANGKPTLICGADYYTNASSTASGIFVDDPLNTTQKYGYLVTSWIHSTNLKDTWQKIIAKYRQLLDSTDRIVFKYRIRESDPSSSISITWYNSGTTFSTSTSLSAWAIGDEVEVVQGKGSGKCAHITAITDLGGGVTEVVLDETFSGVGTDTAKIRIQKWIKISQDISDQISESNDGLEIGVASERIQIKCCLQFTGDDELFEFILMNDEDTPLKN